ncbi:MAG: flavin monoamine oxidase family protein [Kofleriaceae bacterium]
MARSPLFRLVRRLMRRAHAANLGLDPEAAAAEVTAAQKDGPSRRDIFFGALGAAALVPLAAACGDNIGDPNEGPQIAVIGGGMAGLTAAHYLRLAGVRADIYESSMRLGGRMYTDRDVYADSGQLVELGGELVDSDHVVMMAMCQSFGLTLDDLVADTDGLRQDSFIFHNGAFPNPSASMLLAEADIVSAFRPVAMKMAEAIALEDDAAEFARIDNLSIPAFLQDECSLAPTTLIRRLLEISYLEEYGLEVEEQSAWNMIYLIDYATPDPFRVFGDSDERFHIHEGNDALTTRIAAQIAEDRIHLGHALTKVVKNGELFELTFSTLDGEHTVTATRVIYALPFTRLREVDLAESELSEDKLAAIIDIGYGTNAKLMMQFTDRHWEKAPFLSGGGVITDVGDSPSESQLGSGLQTVWATSRGQDGDEGIITNFVGGQRGVDMGAGTAESQAQTVLPWLEKVWPGISAKYVPNSAVRMHWPSYEHTKGSYGCYKVGQWQVFYGTEGLREGNQHFCGEHCSEDYQGYMEGAAETGTLVAAEILDDLEIEYPGVLAGILEMLGVTGEESERRVRASYHAAFGQRPALRDRRRRNWAAIRKAAARR